MRISRGRFLRPFFRVAFYLLLIALPLYASQYTVTTFIRIIYFGFLSVSTGFLIGQAGMVSLTQAAFFGIAGYGLGLFGYERGIPFPLADILAILLVLIFATVFGLIANRAQKIVFLMITLAFGQVVFSASAGTGPAPAQASADPGMIAYVKLSTGDIHVISHDGTGDRVLWTYPRSPTSPAFDLAWRPDGRELAFSSDHELACSWFDSDVYAIGYDGAGYRRVTNSPACAALASLPKGTVTVNVNNYTSSLLWVYVQGAPSIKSVLGGFFGTVTFDNVADFGPGVHQPSIGIGGLDRFTSYPPYADVQPGQTVPGGNLTIGQYSGFRGFGAGKVSWKADGSALAYGL